MKRYMKLVAAWLALGFALLLLLLAGLGHALELDRFTAFPVRELGIGAGALLGFGIILGGVSLRWRDRRAHEVVVGTLARALGVLLLVLIFAVALMIGFDFVPRYSELALAGFLTRWIGPVLASIEALASLARFPAALGGIETAPFVFGGLLLLARFGVTWSATALVDRGEAMRVPRRERRAAPEVDETRRSAAARRVAVASYTQAKSLLVTTEVHLTFVSLDVVGSTAMKHGEDTYVIEQAFTDYRDLVERMLRRHEAYKQTWTPDGQMAAFRESQAAFDCAREILLALPQFNADVSKMRTDFRLRVGMNCGVVSTDDHTPMEKMSDFTIDVAGHMQKYAEPDTIWMAADVFERLTDPGGVEPAGQQVDGRDVFFWRRPD
jgi:class 3 adenylate cyclase